MKTDLTKHLLTPVWSWVSDVKFFGQFGTGKENALYRIESYSKEMGTSQEHGTPLEHVRNTLSRLLHRHHHDRNSSQMRRGSSRSDSDAHSASSGDAAAMARMHSHLGSSTSEATTFPTSAQDYTIHEKIGKGSSSTVRMSCSNIIRVLPAHAPQVIHTLSDL